MRGNHLSNHQYSTSDGVGPYFSSPSDISPARQWTPPAIQEIRVDDYGASSRRGNLNRLFISFIIFGIETEVSVLDFSLTVICQLSCFFERDAAWKTVLLQCGILKVLHDTTTVPM